MEIFHVICINKDGPLVLVMPDKEFETKGGYSEPWGSNWKSIYAESLSIAREVTF